MDHKNLEYLWTARYLNQHQIHWSLFFTSLNFAMIYRPGKRKGKAVALSHKDEYLKPGEEPSATMLKVSNFVNRTIDNSPTPSIRFLLLDDLFVIQICLALNNRDQTIE